MLGSATANVGLIEGGVQVNFVPDRCSIQIDRRLLPFEDVDQVLRSYQSVLDQVAKLAPDCRFQMEPPLLFDGCLETDPNSAISQLSCAVLKSLGYRESVAGVAYGSDASKISKCGIDTILFGPGSIDQAHTADEYIETDQVRAAYAYYSRMLAEF